MIHGSENYSAVDCYHLPYMLAANGIAGFKFDKRGTGGSEGECTQNFPTLAGDVVAASKLLKKRTDIDPKGINLTGFSQGGWIAPLVAQQVEIKSYLIGYGCAVPTKKEDRWRHNKRLQDRGFGDTEIVIADKMNAELDIILVNGDDKAWDRLFLLLDKNMQEDWLLAIAGSDSLLGVVIDKASGTGAFFVPEFGWKMYFDWKRGEDPNFNSTYETRITLNEINAPSLWLLADEDTSVPTNETTKVLKELQQQGKPVEFKVYEGAEHGNVMYKTNENGDRTYTGYASSYFTDIVDWFKRQNT